jgi:hypothetical protein
MPPFFELMNLGAELRQRFEFLRNHWIIGVNAPAQVFYKLGVFHRLLNEAELQSLAANLRPLVRFRGKISRFDYIEGISLIGESGFELGKFIHEIRVQQGLGGDG